MTITVVYEKTTIGDAFIIKVINKYGPPDSLPDDKTLVWDKGSKRLAKKLLKGAYKKGTIISLSLIKED